MLVRQLSTCLDGIISSSKRQVNLDLYCCLVHVLIYPAYPPPSAITTALSGSETAHVSFLRYCSRINNELMKKTTNKNTALIPRFPIFTYYWAHECLVLGRQVMPAMSAAMWCSFGEFELWKKGWSQEWRRLMSESKTLFVCGQSHHGHLRQSKSHAVV